MLKYCIKCKKDTKNMLKTKDDSKMLKTKNGRSMLSSKCALCGSKKSFIKEQEAKGLLSSLGIKTPLLSKMPVLGDAFF